MISMRFGINLRSDLAKLSDAELAAELDRLCEYRKARFALTPRVGSLKGMIWYGARVAIWTRTHSCSMGI